MGCSAALTLYVFTIICAWASFGLGTSAVGAKNWMFTNSDQRGLWVTCIEKDNCSIIESSAALNSVRAFVIIGIVFGFIGVIAFSSGFRLKSYQTVCKAGYGFIYLSALFWTIAMIVYTVTFSSQSSAWGYPYAFGWACVGLLNLGGGFGQAAISKRSGQVSP